MMMVDATTVAAAILIAVFVSYIVHCLQQRQLERRRQRMATLTNETVTTMRERRQAQLSTSTTAKASATAIGAKHSATHKFKSVLRPQSLPRAAPITSLTELLNFRSVDKQLVPLRPLTAVARRRLVRDVHDTDTITRTLVCHDMKGGYTGMDVCPQRRTFADDPFLFTHWHRIDLFVYFSHALVTIPPPAWTNAAHAHGVPILGTLITEWDDGKLVCERLFASSESARACADALVAVAQHHRFDGWLVNVENHIEQGQLPVVVEFVKTLTEAMHIVHPYSQVIWYDSVSAQTGKLAWQGQLNEHNRPFFAVCDGIFLDYKWNPLALTRSATVAGNRKRAVYAGVDIFGRGTYGGGGFGTAQAVAAAREAGLSCALFAPGWTHENHTTKDSREAAYERFWQLLHPHLGTFVQSSLPFYTSFCRGAGPAYIMNAAPCNTVETGPWVNLSEATPVPSLNTSKLVCLDSQTFFSFDPSQVSLDAPGLSAYGSLRFTGTLRPPATPSDSLECRWVFPLFHVSFSLRAPLVVSYTAREHNVSLSLLLLLEVTPNLPPFIVLAPFNDTIVEHAAGDSSDSDTSTALLERHGLIPSQRLEESSHRQVFAPVSGESHARLEKACGHRDVVRHGWVRRHFVLSDRRLREGRIKEIKLVCTPPASSIRNPAPRGSSSAADNLLDEQSSPKSVEALLGDLRIAFCSSLAFSQRNVTQLMCTSIELVRRPSLALHATLHWEYAAQHNVAEPAAYFDIYVRLDGATSFQPIGRAFALSYRIAGLPLPSPSAPVRFAVVPVTHARFAPAPEDATPLLVCLGEMAESDV